MEKKKNSYEICLLIHPDVAGASLDKLMNEVKSLVEKFGGEGVDVGKWDERKLAYPVKGNMRGTYVLCFCEFPQANVAELRHELKLKDNVLRQLILRVESGYTLAKAMAEKEEQV